MTFSLLQNYLDQININNGFLSPLKKLHISFETFFSLFFFFLVEFLSPLKNLHISFETLVVFHFNYYLWTNPSNFNLH